MVEKTLKLNKNRDDIADTFLQRELQYDKVYSPVTHEKGDNKNRDDIINSFIGRELDKNEIFEIDNNKRKSVDKLRHEKQRYKNRDDISGTLLSREFQNDKYAEYGMYGKRDSRRHSIQTMDELKGLYLTRQQQLEIQKSIEKPLQSATNNAIKKTRKMINKIAHPYSDQHTSSTFNYVSSSGDSNFDDLSNTFLSKVFDNEDSKLYKTNISEKFIHVIDDAVDIVDHYAEKFLDFFAPPVAATPPMEQKFNEHDVKQTKIEKKETQYTTTRNAKM